MAGDTVAPRYAHSLQSMTRSIKSAWMIALAMMTIAATSAAAQPVRRQSTRAPSGAVWVERNGKTTVKRGAILDYRSNVIVVQNEAGRGEPISRDDVVRFEYAKSAPHREADQLFTQGAYDRAAEKYAEAMRGELSFWVQRQQQAGRIWCYRNLGKDEQAIDTYLILARNDRELVNLDAAPLAWDVSRVSPNLERQAAELAQRGESPVVKLVGASWLLNTQQRGLGVDTLKQLMLDGDARLVRLAEAQRWRIDLMTAAQNDVLRRAERIESLAPELRAGPHFVIGKALARLDAAPLAAVHLLRVPYLHGNDDRLSAEALWLAGDVLQRAQEDVESKKIFDELVNRFPGSAPAQRAQERLNTGGR